MTPYLSAALSLFLAHPGGYLLAAVMTALALALAYILYHIFGGEWNGLAWLAETARPPHLPPRVWRAVGLAGLIVILIAEIV